MNGRWVRWLPALVVPALIAAGVSMVPLAADAAVGLPAKTPQEVLELAASTSVNAFSGTVVQSADLGLPDVASMTPSADRASGAPAPEADQAAAVASVLEFLSGSHTARVFVDGPSKSRVQVLDSLAERNLIRNGDEAWFYDSSQNSATQLILPSGVDAGFDTGMPNGAGIVQTPAQLAERFLAAVGPDTTVTTGANSRVAGRPVYDLILTPTSTDSLVESVAIGVDSETGLPLDVVVRARGQADPAFQVAFSEVTLTAPTAKMFEFTPPPGATVTRRTVPDTVSKDGHSVGTATQPVVFGAGWESVVSLGGDGAWAALLENPLVSKLTTTVDGGRLLSTSLVNVFLGQDGRVLAGAVTLPTLQNAAAER